MVEHESNADTVLESLSVGRWQIMQFIMLTLFYLCWATQGLSILILGFVPDFACLPPGYDPEDVFSKQLLNVSYGQTCAWLNATTNTSEACSGIFVYAEPKKASIVSEWDLVCGRTFLSDLSQTIFTVGLSIGTVIFTPIADMYGRKKVVLWCHVVYLAVSLLNCLATNITTFIAARFFTGAFLGATGMVGWVITLEIFLPRHRTLAALIANVVWGLCACFLPALGYMMKGYDWRYVQLAMSGLSVIIVGQFLFVDEPLRWLMANAKGKEAIHLIRKAGKINGVDSATVVSIIARYFSKEEKSNGIKCIDLEAKVDSKPVERRPSVSMENTGASQTRVTALALVKHPKLRRVTLVMLLAWFATAASMIVSKNRGRATLGGTHHHPKVADRSCHVRCSIYVGCGLWMPFQRFTNSLTYFGLYMVSSMMSGNRYLNLFFSSLAEVLSSLLVFPIILKCGRRRVLIALHLLAGLSLITAAVLNATTGGYAGYIALTCVVMVGKIGISGTYNIIFMYTPEVYPTNIRAFGVGAASLFSRIGGFLAPFSATVAREVPWAPVAVFGGCCVLVALACPLLPETKGKDLPQTLAELDNLFLPEKTLKHSPNVVIKDIRVTKY